MALVGNVVIPKWLRQVYEEEQVSLRTCALASIWDNEASYCMKNCLGLFWVFLFDVYTIESEYQLGVVVIQNNRQIAFLSRKLSSAQQRYTITAEELLSIIEKPKKFKGISSQLIRCTLATGTLYEMP